MQEMIYKNKIGYLKDILDWGTWHNYEYVILNLHSHPTAYVCLTSDDIFSQKHYDDIPVTVHGGLTFSDPILYRIKQYSPKYKCDVNTSIARDWIIGWDYGHYGDYSRVLQNSGRKYTKQEILEDTKSVIKQLITENMKEAIKERIEEECQDCDEYGGRYVPSLDDIVDIMGQAKLNGEKIETMSNDNYYYCVKILNEEIITDDEYMRELEDIIDEYAHPWSDWDNCDADFYGV